MPPLASGSDVEEIAGALAAFVNASIMARGRPIRPDDPFEAVGVDSMGLLKVLLFIEATYGLWIPDQDLTEENVASPRALATYLCREQRPS